MWHPDPTARPRQDSDAPRGEAEAAARLAHELANLLDGSLRQVALAAAALRDAADPRPRARLEAARAAMERMAALLRRWREYGRATERAGTGWPTAAALLSHSHQTVRQAVEEVLALVAPEAESRGIGLAARVEGAVGELAAGPLQAVILNAFRNSLDALGGRRGDSAPSPPGRIELTAELRGGEVVVRVRDNGGGVSPRLRDTRGHLRWGASTKPGGQGLGLVLAHEIAQGLGGTLELAEAPPGEGPGGRGAVLTLRYPVAGVPDSEGEAATLPGALPGSLPGVPPGHAGRSKEPA